MGLDGVELIMEVEDRFAVTLPDVEVSRIRNVADLAALVIARLPRIPSICPTARMFYTIRRLFIEHANVMREAVRPTTSLDVLFPSKRPHIWRDLRRHETGLPKLETSDRVDRILLLTTGAFALASVGIIAGLWFSYGGWIAVVLGVMMLIAFSAAIQSAFFRLGRYWPQGIATVGDLARAIAPLDVSHGSPGRRLLVHITVLDEVRRLTAKTLGLPLERVKPDSDFVRDLKLD